MKITMKKDFRKGPRAAHSYRDNFWMRKRIEAKLRYKDIANVTGLNATTLGNYFSGSSMPSDKAIEIICKFFDVDPIKGKAEFMEIHRAWDAFNNKAPLTCKKRGYTRRKKVSESTDTVETNQDTPVENQKTSIETNVSVARTIYGKVDYDTFINILKVIHHTDKSSIGEALYGTLDYITYVTVMKLIDEN